MTNRPGNSHRFRASWWKKFRLNLRAQGQICDRKQTHADIADIDPYGVKAARSGEHLHRSVQQLTFPATPVWLEEAREDHL
jgi:hypothetical protein